MTRLNRIKQEFDYRTFVEDHFPHHKEAGVGEMCVQCPVCDDHKFRLYINDDKKQFNCFHCDFHSGNHDLYDLYAETLGISRGQAILRLSALFQDTAPDWETLEGADVPEVIRKDQPPVFNAPDYVHELTDPYDPAQSPHWEYLRGRGLTDAEIRACGVSYASGLSNSILLDRAIFPVYYPSKDLCGYIARTINNSELKYYNTKGSKFAKTFWPVMPAGNEKSAVIVEGILDALALRRQGIPAYATFKKALSQDQAAILSHWGYTGILLCWDPSDAIKEMVTTVDRMKLIFKVQVVDWREWDMDQDPGDTLQDPEIAQKLVSLIRNNRVSVDTWEYLEWKSHYLY